MNRRNFFKVIASFLGISTIYLINKVVTNNNYYFVNNNIFTIPLTSIKEGININDNFIIIKASQNILVFLSKCTHLGCKINFYENDKIICKCHGSYFDLKGKPIQGPANKSLKKLRYSIFNDKLNIYL